MTSPHAGLMLFNGSSNGSAYGIGLAYPVLDGAARFKRWGTAAVLLSGASGAWDDATVKDPAVVKVAGTYHLFYAGFDGTKYQIGKATSTTKGQEWTKDAANPVLTVGGAGAWDEAHVNFPFVIYDEDEVDSSRRWKMWYSGASAATPAKFSIGYAYSADGETWTKHPSNPVITPGAASSWEDEGVLSPAVFRAAENDWTLFYGGRPSTGSPSGYQIGRATFSDPEGTYTKDAGNPIASPSTANQALTSNLAAGGKVVAVGSTAGFSAGEPVFLRDTTGGVQETTVASVDSGTQITITDPADRAWTTGLTATIRSGYYGSITPKSILQLDDTTFVLFGTAFQQFAGSPFYERCAAWTAATVDGTFSVDLDRGLVLPLQEAWSQLSTENPAVILE